MRSVRADVESEPSSSRPQGGCYRRHLLDEDFSGAPAGVQIAGQIRFGCARVRLEQGAYALDGFEIEIRHLARLQPLLNGPALQCARLRAELLDSELFGLLGVDQAGQPFGFVSGDYGRSPNRRPHFPAKQFFDVRENAVSHSIANGTERCICSIVPEFDPVRFYIRINFRPPNAEQWANDFQFDALHFPRGNLPHSAETGGARAAKKIN